MILAARAGGAVEMGRFFCQLCCRPHALPSMSDKSDAINIELLNNASLSTGKFSDLNRKRDAITETHNELNCNTSDFSKVFTASVVTLDKSCFRAEGFWSLVLSGSIYGKAVVVKLYKPQTIYSQRQVFDKFHQVSHRQ